MACSLTMMVCGGKGDLGHAWAQSCATGFANPSRIKQGKGRGEEDEHAEKKRKKKRTAGTRRRTGFLREVRVVVWKKELLFGGKEKVEHCGCRHGGEDTSAQGENTHTHTRAHKRAVVVQKKGGGFMTKRKGKRNEPPKRGKLFGPDPHSKKQKRCRKGEGGRSAQGRPPPGEVR